MRRVSITSLLSSLPITKVLGYLSRIANRGYHREQKKDRKSAHKARRKPNHRSFFAGGIIRPTLQNDYPCSLSHHRHHHDPRLLFLCLSSPVSVLPIHGQLWPNNSSTSNLLCRWDHTFSSRLFRLLRLLLFFRLAFSPQVRPMKPFLFAGGSSSTFFRGLGLPFSTARAPVV